MDIQHIFIDSGTQHLIVLTEFIEQDEDMDVFKVVHSNDEEDFTEYQIQVFLLSGDTFAPYRIRNFSEEAKERLGEELKQIIPATYVANPYFDELMLFFGHTIYTSQDSYKPINCDNCDRKNLYEKRDKANKSDFINKIQGFLEAHQNSEWPFTGDLLIQFSVSDKKERLKEVDIDNLTKTLFDSLQGKVFSNDSQIVGFAATKSSVMDFESFIVGIRKLSVGEKPVFQEFLFSSKRNAWKKEYALKNELNKLTRFITYSD